MEIEAAGPILISLDCGTTITLTRDELEELVDKAIDILEPGEADIEEILEDEPETEAESSELTALDLVVAGVMALMQEAEGGDCDDCD